MTAEAVRWLEEQFDSHRIPGVREFAYESPQTPFYGYTQPLIQLIDDDECLGDSDVDCIWFTSLHPGSGASVMLLGLPWDTAQERAWLDRNRLHDEAYDKRYETYRIKGKERT